MFYYTGILFNYFITEYIHMALDMFDYCIGFQRVHFIRLVHDFFFNLHSYVQYTLNLENFSNFSFIIRYVYVDCIQ